MQVMECKGRQQLEFYIVCWIFLNLFFRFYFVKLDIQIVPTSQDNSGGPLFFADIAILGKINSGKLWEKESEMAENGS